MRDSRREYSFCNLCPGNAVGRAPDVIVWGRVSNGRVASVSANQPELSIMNRQGVTSAGFKRSVGNYLCPGDAIGRRPDVVVGSEDGTADQPEFAMESGSSCP